MVMFGPGVATPGTASRPAGNNGSAVASTSTSPSPSEPVGMPHDSEVDSNPQPIGLAPPPVRSVGVADTNATYGQKMVTLTATITADGMPDSVIDDGFVTFTIMQDAEPIATLPSAPVSRGVATAVLDLKDIPAGGYSIRGLYDTPNSSARSDVRSRAGSLTIAKAGTSTTLTSSVNPAVRRQTVTFTAEVSSQAAAVPTGSVEFFRDGDATPLATATVEVVDGKAVAIFTTSDLPVGRTTITAVYAGSPNFDASSAAVPVAQTVRTGASTASRR